MGDVIPFRPLMAVKFRECPKCAYAIPTLNLALIMSNAECPGCHKAVLSEFKPVYTLGAPLWGPWLPPVFKK